MKVLAIDPGFERMGVAIIERIEKQKDTLLYSECFKTKKELEFHERLALIGKRMEEVIALYAPQVMAIEKLYFSTNTKTAMKVGEARGVIMHAASRAGLSICEYAPGQIKLAVTGYGNADKRMVMGMVPKLIQMNTDTNSDDELDAIAIGLTCLACERFSTEGSVLQRK